MDIPKTSLTDEIDSDDCDCYLKICFASCYCVAQMTNIISQIIRYYPKDNIIVTLESGNAISGRPGALFPSVYPSIFQLVDSQGKTQEAFPICKIASIAITSATYNDNISYIQEPLEPPTGCDANCESAIRQYLPIGSDAQIKAGGQTVAYGVVHINEYGIIVIVDKENRNPVFVSTCKIESFKH